MEMINKIQKGVFYLHSVRFCEADPLIYEILKKHPLNNF
jgi:hypothetical protein